MWYLSAPCTGGGIGYAHALKTLASRCFVVQGWEQSESKFWAPLFTRCCGLLFRFVQMWGYYVEIHMCNFPVSSRVRKQLQCPTPQVSGLSCRMHVFLCVGVFVGASIGWQESQGQNAYCDQEVWRLKLHKNSLVASILWTLISTRHFIPKLWKLNFALEAVEGLKCHISKSPHWHIY